MTKNSVQHLLTLHTVSFMADDNVYTLLFRPTFQHGEVLT